MERHTHTNTETERERERAEVSAPVSGFSEQRHDVCVTCLFCKAEINLGQCVNVCFVCVYLRERASESEFSHHAENLTPVSFSAQTFYVARSLAVCLLRSLALRHSSGRALITSGHTLSLKALQCPGSVG